MAKRKKYILSGRRDEVIALLLSDLRKLRRDKDFVVEVARLEMHVSDAQRGLFWIWMEICAADIGEDKVEFYEHYIKNSPVLNGRGISEISEEEMTGVMSALQRYLAEWGYYLPSGHDEYYEGLEHMQAEQSKWKMRKKT